MTLLDEAVYDFVVELAPPILHRPLLPEPCPLARIEARLVPRTDGTAPRAAKCGRASGFDGRARSGRVRRRAAQNGRRSGRAVGNVAKVGGPGGRALNSLRVNALRELRARIRDRVVFYSETIRATREVGALTRTSAVVASTVAAPLAAYPAPRAVLEVGAGTGALTQSLLERLGPGDRLDLCEINPRFVRLLRDEFARVTAPTVRIFGADVEALPDDERYDVIVSSLPWMNFDPDKVQRILERFDAGLRAGGAIIYIDYWANAVRTLVGSSRERQRLRRVIEVTHAFQRRYSYQRRVIPWNVPPACVHHLVKPR